MSRNRIIYNVEGVGIGPSPASGAHWINTDTTFGDTTGDLNLIQPMSRVQSVSYGINVQRAEIKELGKRSTVARPIVNYPTVDLTINYLQNGVYNEKALGFCSNYTEIEGSSSGIAHYANNSGVFLLSGLVDRSTTRETNGLNWPYLSNDIRNIFVGIETEGNDVNLSYYSSIHPRAKNVSVVGFGNCYLNHYQAKASVGGLPNATVSFTCENMAVYSSGYNAPLPALSPKSGLVIPTRTFTLPNYYWGDGLVSVVVPGNITATITQIPQETSVLAIQGTGSVQLPKSSVLDLGSSFTDIKLQSYNIDLTIPRYPLQNLGYKLPLDREVTFPVYATVTFDAIVGDSQTGRLNNLVNNDDDYNITIKLQNPTNNRYRGTAVRYDFLGAKFESLNYRNQIGEQKTASFSFATELDPDDLTKGLFMSGLLNVDGFSTLYGLIAV